MQFNLQISTVFYSEKTYFRFSYSSILDRLIENLFLFFSYKLIYSEILVSFVVYFLNLILIILHTFNRILQCFDAVGWAAGRASGL